MTKRVKSNLELKQELYQKCIDFVEIRMQTIQKAIKEIKESLLSETKSSAGDKHETGRAMLQLEREKAGRQLSEIENLKEILLKVDITKISKTISLGSLVFTSKDNYFIAISAGEMYVDRKRFYAISPQTPIGKLLMGKTKDDEFTFLKTSIKIVDVV